MWFHGLNACEQPESLNRDLEHPKEIQPMHPEEAPQHEPKHRQWGQLGNALQKHAPGVIWNSNKKKLFPREKYRCITGSHNCWVLPEADLSQDQIAAAPNRLSFLTTVKNTLSRIM